MADIYKSKYTGEEIENILDKANSASDGTTVVPNPSGDSTEVLNNVQIGDTVYEIPVGSTVVANPDDTAPQTEVLTKLRVDFTDYTLPSGGTTVTANPVEVASNVLENIRIGDKNYQVQLGEPVVANPTDTGTSTEVLEKLRVGEVDYTLPSGGTGSGEKVYIHRSHFDAYYSDISLSLNFHYLVWLSNSSTPISSYSDIKFGTIVGYNASGKLSNTPVVIDFISLSKSIMSISYIKSFSTSGSALKNGTPTSISFIADNVYDMSGSYVDGWASGN